jgi:hypothetical protein
MPGSGWTGRTVDGPGPSGPVGPVDGISDGVLVPPGTVVEGGFWHLPLISLVPLGQRQFGGVPTIPPVHF